MIFVVWTAAMHRVAVVPDDEIALSPSMAIDELPLGRVLGQIVQQQAAIRDRPADDVRCMRRQVQALSAGAGMAPHETLARRRILLALTRREFGKADLAARPEDVVLGDQRID